MRFGDCIRGVSGKSTLVYAHVKSTFRGQSAISLAGAMLVVEIIDKGCLCMEGVWWGSFFVLLREKRISDISTGVISSLLVYRAKQFTF